MSFKFIPAALVLAIAGSTGAAFADTNTAQIAAGAGVSADSYSLGQIVSLKAARAAHKPALVQWILAHPKGADATQAMDAASVRQLELALGVPHGQYSPTELVKLYGAIELGNRATEAFILKGETGTTVQADSVVAKAQLARSLGVNPADYTLSELIALQPVDRSNG